MSILDKSREYGNLFPPQNVASKVALYEQDDCWYDKDGKRVLRPGEKAADKPKMRVKPPKPAWRRGVETPKKFEDNRRQFPRQVAKPTPEETAFAPETGNKTTVNLAEWGTGQKKYLWFVVQKAIRDRFNVNVTDKIDALELLMKEGVIPKEIIRSEAEEAAA